MNTDTLDLFKNLTELQGAPGNEHKVRAFMKKELEKDCIIGLIDIDHSYNVVGSEKFDRVFLENMFYGMHDNSHNLFMSVVSKEGKEKWK